MSIRALTMPPKILAAPLSSSGTRLILPNITGWNGSDVDYASMGTVHYVALQNFSKTRMELIEIDPSTMNVATTTGVLINKRRLSYLGGTTADAVTFSDDADDWPPNETFVLIGSNPPQIHENYVDLDEAQTITGVKTFNKDTGRPKLSADEDTAVDEEFVSFGQLARQAIAGAADATETVAGLVEKGTASEATAGTQSGSVAELFLTPDVLSAQIQKGSWLYGVEDGTGADDTYTWTTTPVTTATEQAAGAIRMIKFTVANTGAATGNENAVGAMTIKKYVAGALADLETGDIVANQPCLIFSDGTFWILLNPSATLPTTAILSEMATFFGATDITGAEAESLTGGISSPLTTLHAHKRVAVTHTYDLTTATGTENVAHGLGVAPNWVKIRAYLATGASTDGMSPVSDGHYDGANYDLVYLLLSSGAALNTSTAAISIIETTNSAADRQTATISTIDATNITLSWTKAGSPTGTAYMIIECGV